MEDDAAWPILICILGDFCVLKAGRPVDMVNGAKAEALLCALALRPTQPLSREALLATLWPDKEAELAGQSLHSLLYKLHRLLGDALGGAPSVLHTNGWYRLNIEAGVGVDVACFEALIEAGKRQSRAGDVDMAIASYGRAAPLYRGDLCVSANSYALVRQEYLRDCYCNLLLYLAEYHFATGNYTDCLDHCGRLLVSEPCCEEAHRLVMRCHARRGQRADALRQYRLCALILHMEFDVEPEPATTALFEQVRHDPSSV